MRQSRDKTNQTIKFENRGNICQDTFRLFQNRLIHRMQVPAITGVIITKLINALNLCCLIYFYLINLDAYLCYC